MTLPIDNTWTHQDLGEGHYPDGQGAPGAPDHHIHDGDYHKEFYGKDGPEPFGA